MNNIIKNKILKEIRKSYPEFEKNQLEILNVVEVYTTLYIFDNEGTLVSEETNQRLTNEHYGTFKDLK